MYAVLALVLYSLTLMPIPAKDDGHSATFRWQLAVAVSRGTRDSDERRVLVRFAWLEGWFSRAVASCKIRGDGGRSLGIFQVQPRDARERARACGTLDAQVALALEFMRRSRETCAAFPVRDQLSLYTTGRCMNNREAQNRWGQGPHPDLSDPTEETLDRSVKAADSSVLR